MSTAQAKYDTVFGLVGYDAEGNLRVTEEDGWWEQAIQWAADPVRVLLRMPAAARPDRRTKKQALVVTLAGPELTEPSSL